MYSTGFRTCKIALPPQIKTKEGKGPQIDKHLPQKKYLYWSISKKSRRLGIGVFIDIWSIIFSIRSVSRPASRGVKNVGKTPSLEMMIEHTEKEFHRQCCQLAGISAV
jgi:hypothetical protein